MLLSSIDFELIDEWVVGGRGKAVLYGSGSIYITVISTYVARVEKLKDAI